MGFGSALGEQDANSRQVPRLTTMLRAFATEAGALNIDALYLERQRLLGQQKGPSGKREEQGLLATALGLKPPKAARDAYDAFLKAIASALGGEVPTEDVQTTAKSAWDAIEASPKPDASKRISATAQIQPIRGALQNVLGTIQGYELQQIWEAFQKLKEWQQRLGIAASAKNEGEVAAPKSTKWSFGADLGFRIDGLSEAQPSVIHNDESQATALLERIAGGNEAGVEAMRKMYRGRMAESPGPSAEAVVPPDDIEDEYLPKKPAAPKVRAQWLLQWAERSGAGSDLATAAARTLLTATTADQLGAELFDLLGESNFAAIQNLLELRKPLTENLRAQIAAARTKEEGEKPQMPSYGVTVSISRQSDKLMKKLERQDKRRGRAHDPDLEWLITNQADALQMLAGKRLSRQKADVKLSNNFSSLH